MVLTTLASPRRMPYIPLSRSNSLLCAHTHPVSCMFLYIDSTQQGSYCADDEDCFESLLCINATCASPLADVCFISCCCSLVLMSIQGTTCVLGGANYCLETSECTPTNVDGTLAKCIPSYTQGIHFIHIYYHILFHHLILR